VANPGCYATSILMALLPLLRPSGSGDPGIIDPASLVIDAKSGTSGAGRKANEDLLFTEVDGDCLPYRVGKHQHIPEIIQAVQRLSGVEIDPLFATNLLPVRRGITSGIYARLRPGKSLADVAGAFESAYAGYPLLAHGAIEEAPKLLSLRRVAGSPRTQIAYTTDGNKLYLFSAIDNLLKGAASQAVENLNRLLDLPLETGLLGLEGTLT
jgi:N-acetyl-gamma-glutamyl-phosphate reductase